MLFRYAIVPREPAGQCVLGLGLGGQTLKPKTKNKVLLEKLIRLSEADPQGQAKASGIWQPCPISRRAGEPERAQAQIIPAAAEGGQAIFVTDTLCRDRPYSRGAIEATAFSKQTCSDSARHCLRENIQPILDGK